MQITMIQFSPSGNTMQVTRMLQKELASRNQEVQVLDITGDRDFFAANDIKGYLAQKVRQHDVLLIGGPVYAHHLQYHVLDLIKALPRPDVHWGRYVVPYVTYGGISSGVALKEAAKLLKQSGRLVAAALKVSAPHSMTRAFMPKAFNGDKLNGADLPEIAALADRIAALDGQGIKAGCHSRALAYNGMATAIKAKIVFQEKVWHAKRYPQIHIVEKRCAGCGKCADICPVGHLTLQNGAVLQNERRACIHCFNCVTGCSAKAIELAGDLTKGRAFMGKMIAKHGGKELPATGVYPV